MPGQFACLPALIDHIAYRLRAQIVECEAFISAGYGAAVFSGISKAKLDESVAMVLDIPDDVIEQMVAKFGPGSEGDKKALAAKLIARRNYLAKKFPDADLIANPPKPDPRKLPIDASKLPKLPNFLNWNGKGSGLSGNEKVNEANQKAVQEIYDAAMKGNYLAIKSLKYHVVDKTTGAISRQTFSS